MASIFMLRECAICSKEFWWKVKSRNAPRYCSKSCAGKSEKSRAHCIEMARKYAPIRGDAQRGTGTRGYVKRDGRHEHRVVMEQILGRPLTRQEVVHHKDENKHNNDPSNLEVITQGEHMRRHGLGIPGMTLWWKPEKNRWKRNVSS